MDIGLCPSKFHTHNLYASNVHFIRHMINWVRWLNLGIALFQIIRIWSARAKESRRIAEKRRNEVDLYDSRLAFDIINIQSQCFWQVYTYVFLTRSMWLDEYLYVHYNNWINGGFFFKLSLITSKNKSDT